MKFLTLWFFFVYFAVVSLMALWTDRSLDFVCTHFSHHAVHIPYWVAWVASLFSFISTPFNIVVEIVRHCM